MVRTPNVAAPRLFQAVEDRAEQALEICEAADAMRVAPLVAELFVDYPIRQEVEECVGLCIDVVPAQ